jgi:T5SS/PEP-CTERM-associated repeat protein/autotransporter-associated beta strand protein
MGRVAGAGRVSDLSVAQYFLPRCGASRVSPGMKVFSPIPFFATFLLTFAPATWGQLVWNGPNGGDWNTVVNWSPNGIPDTGTEVRIGTTTSNRTAAITSADARSATAYIGYTAGTLGTVNVLNGWTWTGRGELYVGSGGTGTLNLQSGVVINTNGIIGDQSSATGTVTVSGASSQWNSTGVLHVGAQGNGTLNVQSGGKVSVTGNSNIGFDSVGVGHATVDGSGSLWSTSGILDIGVNGAGTLTVQNSGKVTAASIVMADSGSNSTGTLNINGTSGSRGVLETASISEGTGSGGGTIVFNGGILRATTNSSDFISGFEAGDVVFQSGGAFFDTNGHNITITVQFSGTGGIDKQGTGTLTLSGDRTYTGTNVVEGGTMANVSSNLNNASMTVTGTGTQWNSSVNLVVGLSLGASLTVQSGGAVNSGFGNIGFGTGITGTVTVTGTNSQWTSANDLNVGYDGTGSLNIQSGGTVSTALGRVGRDASGAGSATVSGSGSRWSLTSTLTIGDAGTGTVTADSGSKVTTSNVVMANTGSAKGTLNLNGTSGSRAVLETGYMSKGSGSGGATINFNGGILRAAGNQTNFLQSFAAGGVQIQSGGAFVDTQSFNIGISTALQGTGGLGKQGAGKLTLSGVSTYAGLSTVEAGTLEVTGSLSGSVTAQSGGTLSGTGTVAGVTLQSGASVSPGVSGIGTLHTQGETWNGGGSYLWDIGAGTGTPGSAWDFIDAAGALSIAATSGNKFTLDINGSVSGLTPSTNYQWTILTASGGFGGTFAADEFAFDTAGFTSDTGGSFSVTTSGNNLVLSFAAAPEPGSAALGLFGALILATRRARDRRRSGI